MPTARYTSSTARSSPKGSCHRNSCCRFSRTAPMMPGVPGGRRSVSRARSPLHIRRGRAAMGNLLNDVQYAVRQLRRSPGFAITAALTLSLGIGATTAIFTLIYNTMLKALPVQHASQLYMVGKSPTCCNYGGLQGDKWRIFSNDLYLYFRDHTKGFENLTAFQSFTTPLLTRRVGDSH